MRIAYLFLNGELKGDKEFFIDFLKENKGDLYCADGGANLCYELGLIPKEVWGDLDSIKREVKEYYLEKKVLFKEFKPEKDYTDTELILEEIYKKYKKIFCIGGLGGEIGHELSNINLLSKYEKMIFLTEKEKLFKVERSLMKDYKFQNMKDKKISFIPLTSEVMINFLKGFKYETGEIYIKKYQARLMSNIIIKDEAILSLETGELLCVIEN